MTSELRQHRRRQVIASGVYLVTEAVHNAGRTTEKIAGEALEAGVSVIQVREKEDTGRQAYETAVALRTLTEAYGALLLVNDRVDFALAVGADGVHLGQEDLPLAVARRLLGRDACIGLSISDPLQLSTEDASHADYLGVGAVYPTDTKADATLTGLDLLDIARRRSAAPIVAIGGISAENAAACFAHGADAVAVITAISQAPDPHDASRRLLEIARTARGDNTAGASW